MFQKLKPKIWAPLSTFETIVALAPTSAFPATTSPFRLATALTSLTATPLATAAPPAPATTPAAWLSAISPKPDSAQLRCPVAAAASGAPRFARTYVAAPASPAPPTRSF